MENKKSLSEEAREQIQQQTSQREKLERWAADRVKPWPRELRIDDYDFRSWAKNASKELMRGGAVYEYARESRKLRCLLALMNPKRPRKAWEIVRPGNVGGKTSDEIDSYPAEANWLPCWFEDLDERAAERALGGYLYCLAELADYLADNISFAELFRTKRDDLEKERSAFRYFMPVGAVEAAFDIHFQQATTMETLIDQLHPERSDQRQRIIQDDGSEVIALRIRWGAFTNKEIGAAMEDFAGENRPKEKRSEEPQRKGRGRQDSVRSGLDALSAMRLSSYVPKTSATSRGELSSYLAGDFQGSQFDRSAIGLFKMVRLGGRGGHIAESNFDALIVEAHELFRREFPFGEDAANAPTLAERIMMKSPRISSQDKA